MDNTLSQLQHLSDTSEITSLDTYLKQSAVLAAKLLNVNNSVILLLGDTESDEPGEVMLRVFANDANHNTAHEPLNQHGVIFEQVTKAGKACLINDLSEATLQNLWHRQPNAHKSLIATPIHINNKITGVVSASGHQLNRRFEQADVEWLGLVGALIGKSIQVIQLQNILSSRFAQLALLREAKANLGEALEKAVENPDQLARILAKSFFREMTSAGFSPPQIVQASSEIITQLSSSLNRHNKRLEKNIT